MIEYMMVLVHGFPVGKKRECVLTCIKFCRLKQGLNKTETSFYPPGPSFQTHLRQRANETRRNRTRVLERKQEK